jgi:TusA-related sulfurtransferase
VKTKLKLEELTSGQYLEVLLDEGDPIANVPRSLKDEGHQVMKVGREDGGYYRLLVKKS